MSFDGEIQNDGSHPWHEFPSGLTEPPVEAVDVEPTFLRDSALRHYK